MIEKRRAQRFSVSTQDTHSTSAIEPDADFSPLDLPIEIIDVSTTGIGFKCPTELPIDHYVNNRIHFGNDMSFYSILRIVRKDFWDGFWHFGCEFLGTPRAFTQCIEGFERAHRQDGATRFPLSIKFFEPQVSFRPF